MLHTKVLSLTGIRETQACCTATRHLFVKVLYGVHIGILDKPIHEKEVLIHKEIPSGSGCVGRSIILSMIADDALKSV